MGHRCCRSRARKSTAALATGLLSGAACKAAASSKPTPRASAACTQALRSLARLIVTLKTQLPTMRDVKRLLVGVACCCDVRAGTLGFDWLRVRVWRLAFIRLAIWVCSVCFDADQCLWSITWSCFLSCRLLNCSGRDFIQQCMYAG
jgi:hypothetical protein